MDLMAILLSQALTGGSGGGSGGGDDSGDTAKQTVLDLTLSASWTGDGPYSQSVSFQDYAVTAKTRVDLVAGASVIETLREDGVEQIYIINDNAVLTAIAIGGKPSASISVQATLSEVM